jgi:hypothetical protein
MPAKVDKFNTRPPAIALSRPRGSNGQFVKKAQLPTPTPTTTSTTTSESPEALLVPEPVPEPLLEPAAIPAPETPAAPLLETERPLSPIVPAYSPVPELPTPSTPSATIPNLVDTLDSLYLTMAYTTQNWIRDAALVKVLYDEAEEGGLIRGLFLESDPATCAAVLRIAEPLQRQEFQAKALLSSREVTSPANSAEAFTNFMARFRKGPTVWTTLEREEGRRSMSPHETQHHSSARVRAKDLEYDGISPVTSYINRIQYMATTYDDSAVLSQLPMAMIGDARVWFDSLSLATKDRMNQSLVEWIDHLRLRFKADSSAAIRKADSMRHTFEDESKLDVRRYLTLKQSLYIEAGEENEDLIVRRLHEGLDPTLGMAITLKANRKNTLEHFVNLVYGAETVCRAQYRQNAEQIRVATASTAKREQRYDNQRYDNQREQREPRYIPKPAARALGQGYNRYQSYSGPAPASYMGTQQGQPQQRRLENPGTADSPNPSATAVVPSRPMLPPPPRQRYPCTLCASTLHIDPQCPLHPRNSNKRQPAQVPVYLAEAASSESFVEVDEDTYQAWVTAYHTTADYMEVDQGYVPHRPQSLISFESDSTTSGNESSGSLGAVDR